MSSQKVSFYVAIFLLLSLVSVPSVQAQNLIESGDGTVQIETIQFRGINVWSRSNVRSILEEVGIQAGMNVDRESFRDRVNQAIKRLYNERLFSDIRANIQGNTLIFEFEEYPSISNIVFRGNDSFNQSKLKDVLLLQRGEPAVESGVDRATRELKNFYESKGFGNVEVTSKLEKAVSGRVVVIFEINEGSRSKIGDVLLKYKGGKSAYDQVAQNWSILLRMPIKAGDPYSPQTINQAKRMIREWYHNRGHLDASVEAKTKMLTRDRGLEVTLVIDEGPVYHMGDVTIRGNELFAGPVLRQSIEVKRGDVFNKRLVAKGIQKMEHKYTDEGYANATIFDPAHFRIKKDEKALRADVSIRVKEGRPFYVEKITLTGNEVTYDKVIMREVRLKEGKLLDGEKKRNSLKRIRGLGYFEKVEMNVDPGSKENTKIVRIRVKEKATGELSFGGGFSSNTGFVGNASVSKDNFSLYDWSNGFTGRGQKISLSASIGSEESNFNISWTDPWFNDDLDNPDEPAPDVPISVGWSAFDSRTEKEEGFDELRTGGSVSLGREFGFQLTNRFDIEYSFQSIEVDDLNDADDPPENFVEEARTIGDSDGFQRDIGAFDIALTRDQRDDEKFATSGYYLKGSTEVASEWFGGNSAYYKPRFDARTYIPFWLDTFWATRFNYKTIDTWRGRENNRRPIPTFEEYFIGGQGSVRGYEDREIAIYRDIDGDGVKEKDSGGQTAMYTNIEYRIPLLEETMQVFLFGDAGKVYEDQWGVSLSDIKASTGVGFRVRSPLGPINISWAQRLTETYDGANDEGEVKLDFGIGSGF